MTTRTIPYHQCPTSATQFRNSIPNSPIIDQYFLKYLDVHGVGGAAGIPENIFEAMFYACGQCGRYMTRRISENHHEDGDLFDYTCVNLSLTSTGPASSILRKKVLADFPILEPLSV
ncbi:hypothetical protein HYPSUDRAFT_210455 [Hypholoma sublateritium FD-334 SS-4]|uniref:Uncharacterized protein n=1 Tax=Hypholoma sublateritium (strain FD-334 SS-4) TaxID=945553 RepID=A0A0D2NVA8_HYPSF|nr:hypothetical protein HYPSUDRAFT_210455 [Hypholoma sublateritium FD-334 SS-4]